MKSLGTAKIQAVRRGLLNPLTGVHHRAQCPESPIKPTVPGLVINNNSIFQQIPTFLLKALDVTHQKVYFCFSSKKLFIV
jgi:hypothetical protein